MRPSITLLALLLTACGSESDPPPPDPGDGKVRPPASGVHTSETAACDALLNAYDGHRNALGCTVGTTRTCPGFLRAQFAGVTCMEYDQGSVDGCIAYYQDQTTCDALAQAAELCVVTAYPGTEPNGCP
jgi:hypothetical protein